MDVEGTMAKVSAAVTQAHAKKEAARVEYSKTLQPAGGPGARRMVTGAELREAMKEINAGSPVGAVGDVDAGAGVIYGSGDAMKLALQTKDALRASKAASKKKVVEDDEVAEEPRGGGRKVAGVKRKKGTSFR